MSGRATTPAFVLLEDGTRFDGESCGAPLDATGEVVFNTSMSGYQESVTDPSYAGQIITFTYPHVGNYGVSDQAMESDRIHARAVIMREAVNRADAPAAQSGWLDWLAADGVAAITGVDTRALVRHIRDRGAMRGGVFSAETGEDRAREMVAAEPSMTGRDLAREVTPCGADRPRRGQQRPAHRRDRHRDQGVDHPQPGRARRRVELHPCTSTSADLLARDPDAIFLANGPGDPAALDYVVDTVRGVIGSVPVFGICLGHQLLCRAVGLETYKLPFGHRGANHPVKDLHTGRIEITSQNHGFAVLGPGGARTIDDDQPVRWEAEYGTAELSHLNLYDRTVEGLLLPDARGATVQYHPEAGPGPHDSLYLFDRFVDQIAAEAGLATPQAAG